MRRYRETHGRTVTFEHEVERADGDTIELRITCEFDAGDSEAGCPAGFFLVGASIMSILEPDVAIMTFDRDQFRALYGNRQLDKIEDYAGDLARDLADDARAEQQAARDEDDEEGRDL